MSVLRIGVIGAGYWGEKLIRVFRGMSNVEVVAVCEALAQRRDALPDGLAACSDVDSLLQRSDIDAVLVATPPSTHFTLAKAVLASGRHCWVEKPLAMRATEARSLVELAEQRNVRLFVDETFLYDPLVRTAKKWIDDGRLGRLFHLSFERLGMGRIRRDSDVWWNSAPHDLSILCHLVPGGIERVHAEGFTYLQPGIADMTVATVRLNGGVSAHIYLSWLSPVKVATMVAVGSKGMLTYEGRFEQRALRFFEYEIADPTAIADNVVPIPRFEATETIQGGKEEPLSLAAAAFVESVRSGVPAASAGEYSQRVVELLEMGVGPSEAEKT
ncbi:MAG: Gfo/Idh/MocA family oxidoreductase [Deltaproteobacteria bacterium]|nr:Gfo/Idh/MocA family oxidoreductase [Deltaproteobacteria bacterium]